MFVNQGWSRKGVVVFGALILALVVCVATVMVGVSPVEAQLDLAKGMDQPGDEFSVGLPDVDGFCVGDKCPGRTCDEVNDRCVGDVTLQPRMGEALIGLNKKQIDRFLKGRQAFNRTFQPEDGLGPVFNQDGCASCHSRPIGGSGSILVTRFGRIDVVDGELIFDPLEELGGSLLNNETISPECAETIPVPPTNVASGRLTNSTLGFGLVEAIPDLDIEINAQAPPSALVSGRVHVVPVLEFPGRTAVGRFGWKSQLATVMSFSADASLQEMGITTSVLPDDNPPNADYARLAACDTVPDPEDVPDAEGFEFVERVTDFQRFLAPPPQTPRSGMTGEAIFETIGCADCHLSTTFSTSTDDELEEAIGGKVLKPYSDFLLHDMGGNGDYIAQGDAGLTEIRTTPLWGLRVRDPLWHDGRVGGGTFPFRMRQAIGLHDAFESEASASAQAFNALPSEDQDHLIEFLNSLGRAEFDLDRNGLVNDADEVLFMDCYYSDAVYGPDDNCSIADVDRDGDVDDADLALFEVALELDVLNDEDDDDEDGDGTGTDGMDVVDLENENVGDDDGLIDLMDQPHQPTNSTTDEKVEDDRSRRRRAVRRDVVDRSTGGR